MKHKLAAASLLALAALTAHAQQPQPSPDPIDIGGKVRALKHHDHFIYRYDKFKDYSVVAFKPINLLPRGARMAAAMLRGLEDSPNHTGPTTDFPTTFTLSAGFGFKTDKLRDEPKYGLVFNADAGGWRFLKDHKLLALIDGERVDLGEGQHDGNVYLGGVSEQMVFDLTPEQFAQFANGKSVEIQLGGFELRLKPEIIANFHELLMLAQR